MSNYNGRETAPVALVTGAAHRIGAAIARTLHGAGMDIALHYHHSRDAAGRLATTLNAGRRESAALFQCDIREPRGVASLMEEVVAWRGGLDLLVNNASTFYPTPLGHTTEAQWEDLVGTNLKGPFFLAQAAASHLRTRGGSIVNIADIHGQGPLKGHTVYSAAKAGNIMITRSLARELGPEVRVNAVAPGAILWPEAGLDEVGKQRIINRTALKRAGQAEDVAAAVLFLAREAPYVTGHVLTVDGGRTLSY